ncbi:MAG: hypothetical protein JWR12_1760 [Mucilaginibacter sp.]|nr:hypothetical protein [Mucilaginibacter sp.]
MVIKVIFKTPATFDLHEFFKLWWAQLKISYYLTANKYPKRYHGFGNVSKLSKHGSNFFLNIF